MAMLHLDIAVCFATSGLPPKAERARLLHLTLTFTAKKVDTAATMATMLSSLLPAPVHNEEVPSSAQKEERELAAKSAQLSLISHRSKAPPYGSRKGWMPSKQEDYGDGGAL